MTIYSKPTRYCEKCGKELIYLAKPGSSALRACDYDGPVPYWLDEEGSAKVVTDDRRVVRCELHGDGAPSGTGYVCHVCPDKKR